jgi:hypothetical protein
MAERRAAMMALAYQKPCSFPPTDSMYCSAGNDWAVAVTVR